MSRSLSKTRLCGSWFRLQFVDDLARAANVLSSSSTAIGRVVAMDFVDLKAIQFSATRSVAALADAMYEGVEGLNDF